MLLNIFRLGPLGANCYLLWDVATSQAVLIDPGGEGDFLCEKLLSLKLNLKYIVLTHGHFDHILGVLPLKLSFNPRVCIHGDDLFLYQNAAKSALHWIGERGDPLPYPDLFLKNNDTLKVGNTILRIIKTPGHTPGSISLYNKRDGTIFTGDTLFSGAVGRTDLSYSNPASLTRSLQKLLSLPGETKLYPGHGKSSTIGLERHGRREELA